MAYCGNCGAMLVDGEAYCRNCGATVGSRPGAYEEQPSTRQTGRIALIVIAVVLGIIVVAGAVYLVASMPRNQANQAASSSGVASATVEVGSGVASAGAGAQPPVTPPPPASTPENPPVKKPSPTAEDVTHQSTFITKNGLLNGDPTLTFDYVQFLTGAAATKAAAAHGDTAENDYYVANDNPKLRTFPVSAAIVIKLHPGDGPQFSRIFSFSEFKALMTAGSGTYGGRHYDWSAETTYYINVKNGKVLRIENQWVP